MKLMEMSLSAGLLILLIVVVRAVAIDKLPKTAFLLLWGVALARLLIPASIPVEGLPLLFGGQQGESYVSFYDEQGQIVGGGVAMDLPRLPGLNDVAARMAQKLNLEQRAPAALSVWALGAAGLAAYYLLILRKSRRALREALPLRRLAVKVRGKRRARVYVSDRVSTPLTYGLFRPRIVLPRDSRFQSREQLRCVLAHETVHIRRFDILWKGLLLLALCLHWFNPAVWLMYALACRDIELSCDERVLRRLGGDGRKAYALTLLRCEEQRGAPVPLASAFAKNAVEERIVSIMRYKKRSRFGTVAAASLLALSLSAFAVSEASEPINVAIRTVTSAFPAVETAASFAAPASENYAVQLTPKSIDDLALSVGADTQDLTAERINAIAVASLSVEESPMAVRTASVALPVETATYHIIPLEENADVLKAQPVYFTQSESMSSELIADNTQLVKISLVATTPTISSESEE